MFPIATMLLFLWLAGWPGTPLPPTCLDCLCAAGVELRTLAVCAPWEIGKAEREREGAAVAVVVVSMDFEKSFLRRTARFLAQCLTRKPITSFPVVVAAAAKKNERFLLRSVIP